jgi:hypothetical protein
MIYPYLQTCNIIEIPDIQISRRTSPVKRLMKGLRLRWPFSVKPSPIIISLPPFSSPSSASCCNHPSTQFISKQKLYNVSYLCSFFRKFTSTKHFTVGSTFQLYNVNTRQNPYSSMYIAPLWT